MLGMTIKSAVEAGSVQNDVHKTSFGAAQQNLS
jgi:hypothetical protein